jgi:hypothetical protein
MMNMAFTPSTPTTNQEVAQLLAILRDCGVDSIWQNPESKLLSFYLQNTPNNALNIRGEIGRRSYASFIKLTTAWWKNYQYQPTVTIRRWFVRYADSVLINQALRISAQENLTTPTKAVIYDENNKEFIRDEADFSKLVTLLTIEGFPTQIWHDQDIQFIHLTYYQYFRQQYGNSKTLQCFRRSIVRRESSRLNRLIKFSKERNGQLNLKTTGTKKYMAMSAYDRLRLMRYYGLVAAKK